MRNISLRLGGAMLMLSGWFGAAHAEKLVDDPVSELTDGTIVTLQCLDTNGGSYRYMNGAAAKTEDLSLGNCYVVRADADGIGFRLQRLTDRTYVGHSTGNVANNNSIVNADESHAVSFVACQRAATDWTTRVDGVDDSKTVSFAVKGTQNDASPMWFNTNDRSSAPKFFNGKGGYSVWYVRTYTPEELLAYVTPVSAPETQLIDGMLVALQCRDHNGGPDWYFNGPAIKSKYLGGDNLFRVCGNATDGLKLQRVADGTYVGRSGDLVASVEESAALTFTAAIATAENWTTKSSSGADNALTVRFTKSGSNDKLNTNQRDLVPKYAGGNGGYSIWYVYAYPPELAMGVKTAEAKGYFNRWHGALSQAEIDGYEAGVEQAVAMIDGSLSVREQFAAVDELYSVQTGFDAVDGRMVTLLNMRRGQYLEVTESGALNTSVGVSERSKWQILHPTGTDYINLINPDSRKFINTSIAAAETSPVALQPAVNVYTDENTDTKGISLVLRNSSSLNLDPNAGNLLSYSPLDDAGAAWQLGLVASEPAALEAGKYYRVRSDRGMWGADDDFSGNHVNEAGTLLGINTVIEDEAVAGEAQGVALRRGGLGTLWQVADGKLVNVAADFVGAGSLYGIGAEGMVVAEAEAVSVGVAENHTAYAAAVRCGGKYLNVAADGTVALSDEAPADKRHNDGSVFYFEEVPAAEAQAMIDAYVAAAAAKNYMTKAEGTDRLADLKKATAIWDASVVAAAEDTIGALQSEEPVSVATANTVREVTEEDVAEVNAIVAAAYDSAIGRALHIQGVHSGRYMSGNATGLCVADACSSNLATVWVLDGTERHGVYRLRNYGLDKSAGFDAGQEVVQPWSDAGEEFVIEIPTEHWDEYGIAADNQVAFKSVDASSYLHKGAAADDDRVLSWSASRHPGSQWVVSHAGGTAVKVSVNASGRIYFGHASAVLSLNESLHESYAAELYVRRGATEPDEEDSDEGLVLMAAAAAIDGYDYVDNVELTGTDEGGFSLNTSSLNPGTYRLTVPMGYFAVTDESAGINGYSQPMSVTFTKSSDGVVTGMGSVAAAEEGAAEYFDLQGRRVANPSRGIYVVRRGNAVSKVMLR